MSVSGLGDFVHVSVNDLLDTRKILAGKDECKSIVQKNLSQNQAKNKDAEIICSLTAKFFQHANKSTKLATTHTRRLALTHISCIPSNINRKIASEVVKVTEFCHGVTLIVPLLVPCAIWQPQMGTG